MAYRREQDSPFYGLVALADRCAAHPESPEVRQEWREHLGRCRAAIDHAHQTLDERGVLRNYEETLRRKDGTMLHTLQNITAVHDGQGRIAQIRGLMLDVTEQKMFQSQLQRERDFNQKILNTTQSMILVLDTVGLISYANRRCYEAGYREEEMIGRHLVDLVDGAQRKEFEGALETTAHGQQVENLEARAKRGDGSLGYFSISLSPMRDEQDAVNSVVVVMTDITDAALLQAKLAHAERMATIGRLVSGVAHEVNNPLAAILGFTDLLIENPTRLPVSSSHIDQVIAEKGLAIVTDTGELERVIGEVVGKNPKAVADFKSGKQAAVGALIGQVMKQAKGADPQTVRTMLVEKLSSM